VQRYTAVQSALAYWCIGTYWGLPVRQNKKAHLLGHVKDLGFDSDHKNPVTRIYMTRVAQPWHQDSADLVGEHTSTAACSLWGSQQQQQEQQQRLQQQRRRRRRLQRPQ
jgi:hypothetical protein